MMKKPTIFMVINNTPLNNNKIKNRDTKENNIDVTVNVDESRVT
jgi:hypothetical protein